jgi:hypothetical protein
MRTIETLSTRFPDMSFEETRLRPSTGTSLYRWGAEVYSDSQSMPSLHKVDKKVQAEHIFLVLVVSANGDLEFGYKDV